ncbi:GNAT family N-acetyltransferase [Nannocystis punicea]|uniref:GNAT family N-acetyltransferase n=1 Tax=Nannocystis punicea TaxID=2995304 RepID=A0ABY7GX92_9BACT|nr:GNAT family N-acetyltransferase [Nannocystis poenicansa]WAS91581.1 GNAT family N-acetyltransferase [Nannocystis poenicansa]
MRELQEELSMTRAEPQAVGAEGFLISGFSRAELLELASEPGAGLWLTVDRSDARLVGYCLTTGSHHFLELRAEESSGFFTRQRAEWLRPRTYLYQIGVRRRGAHRGVGRALVEHVQAASPAGLVTDVVLRPVANEASRRFFSSCGFSEAGVLQLGSYRGQEQLSSLVMTWN